MKSGTKAVLCNFFYLPASIISLIQIGKSFVVLNNDFKEENIKIVNSRKAVIYLLKKLRQNKA
jgi:hypothetical protein